MRNLRAALTSRHAAIGVVLALGLGLRLWGSSFGLPAYARYHPDEQAIVERAAGILWTGDWNLHFFNYPPFYAYVQAAGDAAYFLWGAANDLWEQMPPFVVPQYYRVGRQLSALFGTLTVLAVYLTGRRIADQRSALLSALMLALSYLHIIHSHYATLDVMVGFLATLALLFSAQMVERREPRWFFLAGLSAGLAGATKYNGAVVFVVPVLAHVLHTPWGEWGWLNRSLLAGVGGFLAGFFGGNPFALGNLPEFLNGLATVLHHYGTQQPGFEGRGNWRWYISMFLRSADNLWVVAGLLGLVGITAKHWKKGMLLLAFPAIYYLMASRFVVRFERNMVPLLPFLALGGGWTLHSLACLLGRCLKHQKRLADSFAAATVAAVVAQPLLAAVLLDASLSRTDLRETAGRWVEEQIQPGSRIAIEHYSIPFDISRYSVEDVYRISDHDLAWYQENDFDVLIISDGVWELLRREPQVYADKVEVYNEVTTRGSLLAEFIPDPPRIVVAGYPTVAVYHFAPVRIYRLPD